MISAQIIYGLILASWEIRRQSIVNHVINSSILEMVDNGVDVRVAFDAVLGVGALDSLIESLHDGFRAKKKEI